MWRQMQINWSGHRLTRKLQKISVNERQQQSDAIFDIAQYQRNSVFGTKHKFGRIYDVASYRRSVPIQNEEELYSYCQQFSKSNSFDLAISQLEGFVFQRNELNRKTALPLTSELVREFDQTIDAWLASALYQFPALISGDWLHVGAVDVQPMMFPVREQNISRKLFFSENVERRRENYLLPFVENTAIRLMSFNSMKELSSFLADIERFQEAIIESMFSGEVKTVAGVEIKVVENKKRAVELRRRIHDKGNLILTDFWPELKLIALPLESEDYDSLMYLHLHVADHVPVKSLVTNPMCFNWAISSGFYTGDVILNSDNMLHEFIPVYEHDSQNPVVVLSHELVVGQRYNVLVTNKHGLYRSQSGVTIEFIGRRDGMPMIRIINSASAGSEYRFISTNTLASTPIKDVQLLSAT